MSRTILELPSESSKATECSSPSLCSNRSWAGSTGARSIVRTAFVGSSRFASTVIGTAHRIVIRVIASFDRLAKSTYSDVEPRALLPDRARLRQEDWNAAVEQMLLDVLGEDDGGQLRRRAPAPAIA